MAPRSFLIDDDLNDYLLAHTTPADEVQRSLIAATQALGDVSGMQIAVDQGNLLTLLARLVGARRAIEVGTFTGYSALCIARGLPEDGHLLCCDVRCFSWELVLGACIYDTSKTRGVNSHAINYEGLAEFQLGSNLARSISRCQKPQSRGKTMNEKQKI